MGSLANNRPGFSDASDEVLVSEAQRSPEGDLRAFDQLIRRYHGRVIANCRYITGEPNNAEDLAQDVIAKAYFALNSFDGRFSFDYWLKEIKIGHCLAYMGYKARYPDAGCEESTAARLDKLNDQITPDALAAKISERQLIDAVLNSMSSVLRIPLLLSDMDEFSYEEISRFLGISLSATKMRIKRAREDFRERYQKLSTPVRAKRTK